MKENFNYNKSIKNTVEGGAVVAAGPYAVIKGLEAGGMASSAAVNNIAALAPHAALAGGVIMAAGLTLKKLYRDIKNPVSKRNKR